MDDETTKISKTSLVSYINQIRSFWDEPIDVTLVEDLPGGGARIPNLTTRHDQIEAILDRDYDGFEYGVLICVEFAVYTHLHVLIRKSRPKTISRADIATESIVAIVDSYDAWQVL